MLGFRNQNCTLFSTLVALALLSRVVPGADISSVQSGATTCTSAGVLNVRIQPVDPSKSFLIFQPRHASDRPVGSELRGRIASADRLEFERVTDETVPVPMHIRWYVAEFKSGVRVQRGAVHQLGARIDVPIRRVGSLGSAFLTWSKTPGPTDRIWSLDDPIVGEFIDRGTLQFRSTEPGPDHAIWWEVVEFTDRSDATVQRGLASIRGREYSTSTTLPKAVDPSKAFALVGFRAYGMGDDVGSRLIRAELIGSSRLLIERDHRGDRDSISEISWQVVELNDGSSVQNGRTHFPSGISRRAIDLRRAVDPKRSIAFASVQAVAGQNLGSSPAGANDGIIGVAAFTLSLSGPQLVIERDHASDEAELNWSVVEFNATGSAK